MEFPKSIALIITSRCNLRCKMCFQYGERAQKYGIKGNAQLGHKKELTFVEIKKVFNKINKFYSKNNKPEFFITGGEPFTREDMVDIISYASSQGNKVVVNSNFSLVDKNKAKVLSGIKNFVPLVSIDGPENIHDSIRNVNGTYAKAIRNIKFFSQKGKDITVCTTITRYNVDYLPEIYEKFKGLRVFWFLKHVAWMPEKYVKLQTELSKKYFNVNFKAYFPETASVPFSKIGMLENQIKRIKELYKTYNVFFKEAARPTGRTYFTHHCTFSCKQKNKVCRSPKITIHPDGMISFCNGGACGIGPLYAHILKDELPEILKKRKPLEKIYNQLLNKGQVFPVCVKCSYLENKYEFWEKVKESLKIS
jgi:MoaA/NifB/PqqE/SkfB family radical SAM enzyme